MVSNWPSEVVATRQQQRLAAHLSLLNSCSDMQPGSPSNCLHFIVLEELVGTATTAVCVYVCVCV